MKIILFFMLLSTVAFANVEQSVGYVTVDVFNSNYQKVDNSIFGSGVIINYQKKSYFSTNAHVCYGNQYFKIAHEKQKNDYEFSFSIKTKKQNYLITLLQDQIIANIDEDVCVIQLSHYVKEGINITDKVNLDLHKKAYFLTYNRGKNLKITKFHGKLVKVNRSQLISIDVVANSKEHYESFFIMKEQAQYTFKSIPGDSGSPVFNEKKQLLGLVFSSEKSNGQASIVNQNAIFDLIVSLK